MRAPTITITQHMLTLIGCAVLTACGGGNGASSAGDTTVLASTAATAPAAEPALPPAQPLQNVPTADQASVSVEPTSSVAPSVDASGAIVSTGTETTVSAAKIAPPKRPVTAAPAAGSVLTTIGVQNTGGAQTSVPVTFGQVFAVGDIPQGQTVVGTLNGSALPLQVDVKARHPDGSIRHAIVSAVVPGLLAGQTQSIQLAAGADSAAAAATARTPAALLNAGFDAEVRVQLNGVQYTASPLAKMRSGGYRSWISGNLVNEWHVDVPFVDGKGAPHPHLAARYAIREIANSNRARVDVAIENGYTFVANPQNVTYDVQTTVGGKTTYSKAGLTHYHHTRWRRIDWWGAAPQVHVRHDTDYLIRTKAIPNYDRSIVIPEKTLAAQQTKWSGAKTEPMGAGLAMSYMPTTGGRDDIGIMPSWSVIYLLSMDKRAKDAMLGSADQAGSWSVHFRNEKTGNPVSIVEYPYMTGLGRPGDAWNPVTKKSEAYPACATGGDCSVPHTADTSHQPGFSYLPYLVTGDYYYLEELQFYGLWSVAIANPNYREREKGLVHPEQVRGQAWTLRTLAEAAYIVPDNHPLKSHFTSFVAHNLAWYNRTYSTNAAANKLGALVNGYAYSYSDRTAVAPWQDDFFTAVVGHMVELGFTDAAPLLAYKTKFPILRMVGDGACWIDGAAYTLKLRDSVSAAEYTTIGQVYKSSFAANVSALNCEPTAMALLYKLKVNEMTGYSSSTAGYPSNMQPALAYAATAGGAAGQSAWNRFMSRSVKPDYSATPQFAIVPRTAN